MALKVPLTARDRQLDHHVRIASPESGLSRPSWARTEDITAVSTLCLTQETPLGTVSVGEAKELSFRDELLAQAEAAAQEIDDIRRNGGA